MNHSKLKLHIYLSVLFCFFFVKNSFASESLSYSGRLVQTNGAPVTGQVTIRARLAYTNDLSNVNTFCTQDISNIDLTNGVFHVKFDFVCKISNSVVTLTQFLSQTPAGHSVAIQITDLTHAKPYSFQALHAQPFANVATQLVQMGAGDGDVLKWSNSAKGWVPETVAAATGGTVTNVSVGAPLTISNPTSTPSITLPQSSGSQSGYLSSADWTTFNNKEGSIAGGTAAQFYRGDKSWQTLDTSVVPENSNLYFTNARALDVPLLGFATAAGTIVATDNIREAFGKTQGQINTLTSDSSHFLKKDSADTLSGNTALTGVITADPVLGDIVVRSTPMGMTSAVNKSYVDAADGLKVNKAGDTITGVLTLDSDLKIKGGSNYVTVKGHASSAAYDLFLPSSAGTAGYVLSTDGSGNTSWINPSSVAAGSGTVNSASITDGSIVDDDVNASAAIAQSKIANLTTDLSNKQPLITAGTTSQYFRGDKTFVDLGTDVRGTQLTGYSVGANSSITATDTTLGAFQKVQGQIDATNTAVAGKEASLTAGTTSQYYRGDKSWQTLDGSVVSNTAAGTIAATNVQSALNELDSEKQDKLTSSSLVNSGVLRFYELPGNGTNYTSLKAPDALGAIINYVLPAVAPTAGQVLSSNASGVMSWISIPSAPVSAVHGRSGAVVSANGDYTASQITNVPAGTVAATTVQAALDEIASEKEPVLTNPSDTTKYYRGDKTWATFATDAINSVLSTFSLNGGSKPAVTNTDTVVGAFGKVQKTLNDINADYVSKTADQTINGNLKINSLTGFITVPDPLTGKDAANKDYVDGFGQWTKSGSDIYRSGGNVGIGTSSPAYDLEVQITETGGVNLKDSAATGGRLFFGEGTSSANLFSPTVLGTAVGVNRSMLIVGEAKVAEDTGSTPVTSFVARRDDNTVIVNRALFDWKNASTGLMTLLANGNLGIGTATPGSKLEVSGTTATTALKVSGRNIPRYNPAMGMQFGDQDWTDMITVQSGALVYSAADKGLKATGATWFTVHSRIPIDPTGVYRVTVRVKKVDGTGFFYVGADSLDENFTSIQTDAATSYNYFVANNVNVSAGTTYTASGTISGHNIISSTNPDRFDPGAKFFNVIIIGNYSGSGNSIIEAVEILKIPTLEPWKAVTFQNGWSNYGSGYGTAAYYKDNNGIVHLRGLVAGGTIGGCVFTLPVGYRPPYRILRATQTNPDTIGRLDVATDGCVYAVTGNSAWFSLDGVDFRTD